MPDNEESPPLMPDVPIPTQNSIIVFSTYATTVYQNVSYESFTGAKIVSKPFKTDSVEITPSGNSFLVKATFKAEEATLFSATVTTNGDPKAGFSSVTQTFKIRVLVIGHDFPHLQRNFYEFKVGEYVDTTLSCFFASSQKMYNIPDGVNWLQSFTCGHKETGVDAAHGDIHYQYWVGEKSGLYTRPIYDESVPPQKIGIKLCGTATRPGLYFQTLELDGLGDPAGAYQFPMGNGWGLLMVNVYDDRDSPKLKIPTRYKTNKEWFRFISRGQASQYDTYEHLLDKPFIKSNLSEAEQKSGHVLYTMTFVTEHELDEPYHTFNYQVERKSSGAKWTVSGRDYWDEPDTLPDFEELCSCSAPDEFQVPPNNGWSNGALIAGDGCLYVEGNGFFDWKGEMKWEKEDKSETDSDSAVFLPFYEQQAVISTQYKGWANPPALQHNEGLYLVLDMEGKYWVRKSLTKTGGEQAAVQTIGATVAAYHPSVAGELIAEKNYRDVSFVGECMGKEKKSTTPASGESEEEKLIKIKLPINANSPADTNGLTLRSANKTASLPEHYTWLRQMVPPNGVNRTVTIPVRMSSHETSKETQYVKNKIVQVLDDQQGNVEYENEYDNRQERTLDEHNNVNASGKVILNAWNRSAIDLATGIMGITGSMDIQIDEDFSLVEGIYYQSFVDQTWPLESVVTESKITGQPGGFLEKRMNGLVQFASGRGEDNEYCVCILAAEAFASASRNYTTHDTVTETTCKGDECETKVKRDITSTSGRAGSVAGVMPMYLVIKSFANLTTDGYTVESVSATASGSVASSTAKHDSELLKNTGDGHVWEGTSSEVWIEHSHQCYDGNIPPGLMDYGWTHRIIDGEESWSADTRGEGYKSLLEKYRNCEDVDWGEYYEKTNISYIEETRRESKFSVG